ncbi:MAG: hypothetical protein KDA72_08030 [Planctomycetales bacterium]|nr:hypothetical protein [Planctomycetales bacterium]
MEKRFKAQEKRAKREERKNAPEPVAEAVVVDDGSTDDDLNDDNAAKD